MEQKLVLCDTNIFINWFNNNPDTIERLKLIGLENIVISVISVMELIEGVDNKRQFQQLKKKINNYYIVDFINEVSKLSLKFIEKYNLSHQLQIPDAIIRATAIVHKIPLFTYSTKDFKFMPKIILR